MADATIALGDSDSIESGGTSFSHTNVATGTAGADRYLGIVAAALESTANGDMVISSLTVDSNSATFLKRGAVANGSGSTALVEAWVIALPSGTSSTVAITYSRSVFGSMLHAYEIHGIDQTLVDFATFATATGFPSTFDVSLDIPQGGVGFAGAFHGDNTKTDTWTGMTEGAEFGQFSNSLETSSAYYAAASTQAPLNVDCTHSGQEDFSVGVSVSFAAAGPSIPVIVHHRQQQGLQ